MHMFTSLTGDIRSTLPFPIYNKSAADDFERNLGIIITKLYIIKVELLLKVENIVTKGESAHYEHFLLLPLCFQESSASDASKCV